MLNSLKQSLFSILNVICRPYIRYLIKIMYPLAIAIIYKLNIIFFVKLSGLNKMI